MTRAWEYQTIDVSTVEFDQLDDLVARLAEQGWEVLPRIDSEGLSSILQIVLRRHAAGRVGDLAAAYPSL